MSFERTATRLGIEYRRLELCRGGPKAWGGMPIGPWSSVERAALEVYLSEGWEGHDGEGGLVLSLIKAASFPRLPERLASAFIEGLYFHQGTALERLDPGVMLANVGRATEDQIAANYRVMAIGPLSTPEYFPTVTLDRMLGLFRALGVGRLHRIASIFAAAPYDLRAGWPDLTLWRGDHVIFREVKAPGDQLHKSQKRLIETLLLPLEYDVGLVEVVATSMPHQE